MNKRRRNFCEAGRKHDLLLAILHEGYQLGVDPIPEVRLLQDILTGASLPSVHGFLKVPRDARKLLHHTSGLSSRHMSSPPPLLLIPPPAHRPHHAQDPWAPPGTPLKTCPILRKASFSFWVPKVFRVDRTTFFCWESFPA